MPTPLEQSVAKTVVWFSLFQHPPTEREVWQWLMYPDRTYTFYEVQHVLATSVWLSLRLARVEGYIVWKTPRFPQQEGIKKRHAGFRDALLKYRELRGIVRYISWLPGVVAVGAVNSLGLWHTRPSSDMDLLILVEPGYIWTVRLLSVLPFALLGRRPKTHSSRNIPKKSPVCFSFFLSTDALCIEGISLEGGDPYLAFWLTHITPLYDREAWFATFDRANDWRKQIFPHACCLSTHPYMFLKNRRHRRGRVFVWWWFERAARAFQQWKLPARIRFAKRSDRSIILSDHVLKFHETDRRKEFREGFTERWNMFCAQEGYATKKEP